MKPFLKIIFLFSILFSYLEGSYSQGIPSYKLEAKNFVLVDPMKITFDIVLTHTDANTFEYATGQYFFRLPQSVGTIALGSQSNSGYTYDSAGGTYISDLPINFIPRSPFVASVNINGVPYYELRLASNSLPGAGNGFIFAQNDPKLVVRMKLKSSTPFVLSNFAFLIRDSCSDNPVSTLRTKINVYIGTANTEITRCANHHVDFSGIFSITCNIKLAIEGIYDSSNDKLVKKDTVTAYLRNVTSPYQVIDTASAIIDSNTLTGNFTFLNNVTPGKYYLVIKHKNSIETWSKAGGDTLISGSNNNYDFTTSASQAYGNNMVLRGSRYCIYSGDINQDLIIDISDMAQVDNEAFNFVMGYNLADLNGDNFVDQNDYAIVDNNRLKQAKAPLYGNDMNY
ncbi:MAG: hypothetical protein M3R36_05705 [Bacteroidota bacterium]|nr:hypothetical protein [Bacteroidota bacterium]